VTLRASTAHYRLPGMAKLTASVFAALVLLASSCGVAPRVRSSMTVRSLSCSAITGLISFTPPLTLTGHENELVAVRLDLRGCKSTPSNVANAHLVGLATGDFDGGTNNCIGIVSSRPVKVTITWMPESIVRAKSQVSYSGYTVISAGAQGKEALSLPGAQGVGSVRGGFVGSRGRESSEATLVSNYTTNQILGICGSSQGLQSLPITSGAVAIR